MTPTKPIILSKDELRAALSGTLTEVRRKVKPQPLCDPQHQSVDEPRSTGPWKGEWTWWGGNHTQSCYCHSRCPYPTGTRLWVKETWRFADWTEEGVPCIQYLHDGDERWPWITHENVDHVHDIWADLSKPANFNRENKASDAKPRRSTTMPVWASRLTLTVESVAVSNDGGTWWWVYGVGVNKKENGQ
jgi:hypothetical protein